MIVPSIYLMINLGRIKNFILNYYSFHFFKIKELELDLSLPPIPKRVSISFLTQNSFSGVVSLFLSPPFANLIILFL